jgi:3-hydroxyacyl-CoA dehydrogenase/enoyl-CoA hydratase/3-hydroxybutyryl-CoA epimerase/enoyl-CoA isomerase
MYTGEHIQVIQRKDSIIELVINSQNASVNTLSAAVLTELKAAIEKIKAVSSAVGLIIRSDKSSFVVGANILELIELQKQPEAATHVMLEETHALFNSIENLPFPTVSIINGMALGGGFEIALTTDFRVATQEALIGLPEITLGLCPGWGGNIRVARLAGADKAFEMILSGRPIKAGKAQELGLVDAIVDDAGIKTANSLILSSNKQKTESQRLRKHLASEQTSEAIKAAALNQFASQLNVNTPAANEIIDLISSTAQLDFNSALKAEALCFAKLMQSDAGKALSGLFASDQFIKTQAKRFAKAGGSVSKGAVIGAGVMGGGIAYQSAISGIPVEMKDINEPALDLGVSTATVLLDRQIKKGKLSEAQKIETLTKINPTLDYEGFGDVDMVVEAVVENPKVKAMVLSDVESVLRDDAVLSSNTSTISITSLAESLKRPEQFCGMHFFNPVHAMPLVEVIRGEKTSEATVARAVNYALAMGKKPIVVNDCPGFLVNRILFPYFNAFNRLLLDGADFEQIDRVMETFGWPMGPAYLADVVGIDVLVHADQVLQQGFPDRMGHDGTVIAESLLAKGELGQKSGSGFYSYGKDENGNRFKRPAESTLTLISEHASDQRSFTDQEIIDRLMIPLCMETVRCLEDGIVSSAAEADMGLILGLGFPKFRGGALRYIDLVGLKEFQAKVEQYASLGALYQTTESFIARATENRTFY